MARTIAEALREEGKVEGELEGIVKSKQEILIMLLLRKFGPKLTSAIVAHIERTNDLVTLDQWLGNIVDAANLKEIGIPLKNGYVRKRDASRTAQVRPGLPDLL